MFASLRRWVPLVAAAAVLSACGSEDTPAAPETPPPASTTAVSTAPEETTAETTESTTSSSSRTSQVEASKEKQKSTEVEKARKTFSSLAPDSLFDAFDSCTATGVEGSMACQGPEVGQFQFFDSDAKAAYTTQLLTGLRNSRVINDTGRMVVGWSTLGGTAIITVVDNDLGLVLQQMVSVDEVDPTKKIYELGLAEEPAGSDSSESATATTSEAANPA